MNSKKILAMIVAVAMVVAIVPGLTITAGAASMQTVIDSLGGMVVWSMPEGDWNDTAVSDGIPGWDSIVVNGNGNLSKSGDDKRYFQFYGKDKDHSAVDVSVYSPGYAEAADKIIIEAAFKRSGVNSGSFYRNNEFFDIDGNLVAHAWIDVTHKESIAENPWGYPDDGTPIALVIENNWEENTHTNKWYVNNALVFTSDPAEGVANGFGYFRVNGNGDTGDNNWWHHTGFTNVTIGAVYQETKKTATAKYTVSGDEVISATGTYDSVRNPDGYTFPEKYYSADGTNVLYHAASQTVSEAEQTIAMETVDNADVAGYSNGSGITDSIDNYVIVSNNIIPNGDFAGGMAGWYTGAKFGADTSSNKPIPAARYGFRDEGDGMISAAVSAGNNSNTCLYRSWPIENEKTYAFTYFDSVSSDYHIFSLSNAQGEEVSGDKGILGKQMAGGTKPDKNATAKTQNVSVFTNDSNYKFARIRFRWNNPGDKFGNFGLYEVKKITGVAQQIDITSTIIEGNTPVLPDTVAVNVEGEDGTREVPVVWSDDELKVGEEPITLTATVKGTELSAGTAKVTVLPCTDGSLAGTINSTNANGDGAKNTHKLFTAPVAGKATFEYDLTVKDTSKINGSGGAGNYGVFIGYADGDTPPAYSAAGNAIGLQGVYNNSDPNTFAFKKGDGKGGASTDFNAFKIELNETYRVLIEADTAADSDGSSTKKGSYTAKVYNPDGTLLHEESSPLAFRKGVDSLNALVVSTNSAGTGDGNIVVENFRVSWTEGGTEYTVKAQCDGTDIESFVPETQRAVSQDYLKAPVIDGYALISGPEVTEENVATYSYKAGAFKNAFSFNFKSNAVEPAPTWAGAEGCRIVFKSGSGIIAGVMVFDAPKPAPEGQKLVGAKLNIRTIKSDNNNQKKTEIYVIPAEKVNEDNTSLVEAEYTDDNWKELTEAVLVSGTTTFGPAQSAQYKEMSIDLSDVTIGEKLVIALYETTSNNRYFIAGPELAAKTYIEYEYAETPADLQAPVLGWHDGEFTIDFLLGEGVKADAIEVTPENGEAITGAVSEDVNGLAFKTVNTNRQYTAVAKNKGASSKATEAVSIYSLVMSAVKTFAEGDNGALAEEQLGKVNEVLKKGGLYLASDDTDGNVKGYKLTDEVEGILKLAEGSDENTLTVTIEDKASNAGLSFGNSGTVTTIDGAVATVDAEGKSVTIDLSGIAGTDALEDIFLEEIEFVFEPDEVTEEADEAGEVDFVEEI